MEANQDNDNRSERGLVLKRWDHGRQIMRDDHPLLLACPCEQSCIITACDFRDILSTYQIEVWRAAQQPADDVVIEALVGKPFHRAFRRASRRSRRPFGDHSGYDESRVSSWRARVSKYSANSSACFR